MQAAKTILQQTKQQLHRRPFTHIAEVACTPYPTTTEVISKSNELAEYSDLLCFPDSPFAKPSAPPLEFYIQNNVFASLLHIKEKLMPVMSTGSRNLQQIQALQDQLAKLEVKNLLLVSGDTPKRTKDGFTSLQVLQKLPSLSKTFDIGVATNCDQTQMNYLEQKLESGAKYAVCQITFSLQKMEEYLQAYEKRFKGVPLMMGLCPITTYQLLESLHKIQDMYLDRETYERMRKLSENELKDEGMKYAMQQLHLLRTKYAETVQGIYIYSKSSECIQDIITESSKI